jgi:hypothetical protein
MPSIESKSRLIIVPDGKLHLLPFDSLTDLRGRYVVVSHVVTYSPSASALYLIRTLPVRHTPTLNFLGAGDIQDVENQIWPLGRVSP